MVRGAFPAGFRVRLHAKDLRICREMAARFGVALPVVERMLAEYAELVARGYGDEDISATYRLKAELFERTNIMVPPATHEHRLRPRARVLPAGLLHLARHARHRAHRRAHRVRAHARAAEPGGRLLDRPGAHLAVPAVDRTRGAALLCAVRTPLARSTVAVGSAVVLALITALVATVSVCAYLIGRTHMVIDSGGAALFPESAGNFAIRNVWIGLVVTGLALRYFYVAHEWRRSVELRAAARVHALQARIRPHFLFNSMNTIAALTRSNPSRAEQAVQDLADLFRATLSDKRDTITLAEELEVARTYQRMEQLRLGGRLHVSGRPTRCPAMRWYPIS